MRLLGSPLKVYSVVSERPVEALVGGVLIVAGWLFYLVTRDRVGRDEQLGEQAK